MIKINLSGQELTERPIVEEILGPSSHGMSLQNDIDFDLEWQKSKRSIEELIKFLKFDNAIKELLDY